MKAKIEIEMNNAAFDVVPGYALACILRIIANRIEDARPGDFENRPLHDSNGNRVGKFEVLP